MTLKQQFFFLKIKEGKGKGVLFCFRESESHTQPLEYMPCAKKRILICASSPKKRGEGEEKEWREGITNKFGELSRFSTEMTTAGWKKTHN